MYQLNKYPVAHPFGVTMFEDTIYWTDWQTGGVQSMDKRSGMDLQMLHGGLHFPMDIKVLVYCSTFFYWIFQLSFVVIFLGSNIWKLS